MGLLLGILRRLVGEDCRHRTARLGNNELQAQRADVFEISLFDGKGGKGKKKGELADHSERIGEFTLEP